MKLARGFLYIVAILTFVVIAAFIALRMFPEKLSELTFVPTATFARQEPLNSNAYSDATLWFSHPAIVDGDPARWQPGFAEDQNTQLSTAAKRNGTAPPFVVFFVHPTSYFGKNNWNAPLDDQVSQDGARLFLKGMASPFNQASEIWTPRYRQATFGSFLTDDPRADQALDAAYGDIELAFAEFLQDTDPKAPIVLAGHSQGTIHLLRLLRSKIAATSIRHRIAAVYAIGWPISVDHDLSQLGLPACSGPEQPGCLVSWVSFAEPAEPGQMLTRYNGSLGFDGRPRKGSAILCTNPLTGKRGGSAPASANLGTLVPSADMTSGELEVGAVPATCRPDGILLIGDPPDLGHGVLPGNNYHVYDIPLFWSNLRQDVARRVEAWSRDRL